MRYKMTLWMDSRYDETSYEDRREMKKKIRDFAAQLMHENNSTNKHVGLHAKIVDYAVVETEKDGY